MNGESEQLRPLAEGGRIFLRAFELDDVQYTHKWRADPEVFSMVGGRALFVSSVRERKWVEEKALGSPDEFYVAICLRDTSEMIGWMSLVHIDRHNRSAEWNGPVIGDRDSWNKGYGTEAGRLVLTHAFLEMGLHRVYGFFRSDNVASIRVAEKLGFVVEGKAREALFRGGGYHDLLLMAVLQDVFIQGSSAPTRKPKEID